ncbi:MAG: TonB-dependent receptor [FCB group bacterium]|nr:TonB-dependent receptor [FCB group bacterium]
MIFRPITGSRPTLFFLIFFIMLPVIVLAGTTGKLVGTVTNAETGDPLVGVNIILEGTSLGAATNSKGKYLILRVPPGVYTVKASMIGYQDVRIEGVRVRIDLTTRLDIKLNTSVVGLEEVTVTAERSLVQPDVTFSQANISSEEISALPIEEFEEIVALQAGVVLDASGAIHIRGGRSTEIAYMIDGITVTDPYSNGMAIEIENNAIQELQLISGTFNAEYGAAMSGVVNIVTKEGSIDRYKGNVQFNLGDYVSSDTAIFPYINRFNPASIKDLQGSLGGPLPLGFGSFFVSGRYYYDDGYLYGQRRYSPDSFVWRDTMRAFVQVREGDNAVVPMNWVEQFTGQGKFTFRLTDRSKISVNLTGSKTRFQNYAHKFKYNPDGDYQRFRSNYSLIGKLEQSLSPNTYFILRTSLYSNTSRYYRYKDPLDPRYNVDPIVFSISTGYNFNAGGIRMGHFDRETRVITTKFDLVSQLTSLHQVKLGAEWRKSRLFREDFTVLYNENTAYQPQIPTPESPYFNSFTRTPSELSGYVQDKIEYDDLIMNIGVRYDYFEPDWRTLSDPSDPNYRQPIKPINQYFDEDGDGAISEMEARPDNQKTDADRYAYWYKKASPKHQLSPRLALAFPITDRGSMHISYGHFFQIPANIYLYTNPDFEVTPGLSTTMGNADMEPERTTQYELGFQQQIGVGMVIDVTGFYKDIRNLVGTKIVDTFIAGDRYALYINRDYGNVRGITFSFNKQPVGLFSGMISYTYSIAEGNASDPAAAYYDELSGVEPEKQLVALDWDQRHTLNGTITFHPRKQMGISLVGQYGSGLPYTPSLAGTRIAYENSGRKPVQYSSDVRSYFNFRLLGLSMTLHFNIYNLLDRRNEVLVYNDTGRATYSLIQTYVPQQQKFNTLDEYLVRPDYYSAPRQVKFGLTVNF